MASDAPGDGKQAHMDKQLLKAAQSGDYASMKELATRDPSILLGTTPQGNNCLHISSIHGHLQFCRDVMETLADTDYKSLPSNVNVECQTPLVIAITHGHASLACFLLGCCSRLGLEQGILKQDANGCNALHHAIRNGHTELALELIEKMPALSQAVNKYAESPMFIAVMRDFTHVFERLIEIPDSPHGGPYGRHALHAAARNGNQVAAKKIMDKLPHLATQTDSDEITPIRMSVYYNKVDVLRVLLEHDPSLAYEIDKDGYPLLCSAAAQGKVDAARELLNHCPDALYCPLNGEGGTCLHIAVWMSQPEFTEFIVRTPRLWKLINMRDQRGRTALHYAVEERDPRLVAALLSHKSIDTTVLDSHGKTAASQLSEINDGNETLAWKELHVLLLKADPKDDAIFLSNLRKGAKKNESGQSTREQRSLTQKYTSNTSLVAVLLSTITFTAAFTLPGGYSNDAGREGLPIMSRKIAFQAFLISDTLAMCSSFVVAFICLMGKWEDDKFTTYYISVTKKLTWLAYMTTITAFSTGLYTVLASQLHWLAIGICSLVAFLPILTMFIGKWPVLRFHIRWSVPWPKLKLKFQLLRQTWHALMLKCRFCQGCKPNSHGIV